MSKHIRKIDRIRVFFCLSVLFYHLGLLPGGYLAVTVFFVLNGFLSTRSLLQKKKVSLKDYYLGRLLRLYLPMLTCALCTAALLSLFPEIRWFTVKKEILSVLFSYNNLYQASAGQDYFARSAVTPLLHLWYVSLLIQYDLILPFLVIGLKRSRKISKGIPVLCLFLLIVGSYVLFLIQNRSAASFAYYGLFSRAFSFLSGVLSAFLHSSIRPLAPKDHKVRNVLFYVYILILFVLFCFVGSSSGLYAVSMLMTGFITMRLISYAAADAGVKENGDEIFYMISEFSYGIYLIHYPIWYLLQRLSLSSWLAVPLMILLTFILAALFKIPFLRGKRKNGKGLRLALSAFLLITGIFGGVQALRAEDYSEQMKELEEKLEENRKLIEEKNREVERNAQAKKEAWEALYNSGKSDEEAVSDWMQTLPIVGVGDSIMLDAVSTLYGYFPQGYFDCEISRSLYYGEQVLRALKEEGKLSEPIVLSLSNNGDFSQKRSEELMEIVEDREVFWINAVGADDPSYNRQFDDFAKGYPNMHIIYWDEISKGYSEYFYYDGIHVIGDGVKAYSKAIYDTVYERYLEIYRENKAAHEKQGEEMEKEKIVFYGNDALISSYPHLGELTGKALFRTDLHYDYDSIYDAMKSDKEQGALQGRAVLVFDKSAGLKEKDYRELSELCEGEVIVISIEKNLSPEGENIRVLHFDEEIREHSDYLLNDRIHLSDAGAEALGKMIAEQIR